MLAAPVALSISNVGDAGKPLRTRTAQRVPLAQRALLPPAPRDTIATPDAHRAAG